VVVQVDTTTICGTDLHLLKGDVPAVTDGRVLGHEGVGTITEVGQAVSQLAVGDRVIISCISSCGSCSYCHQQLPSHCLDDEGTSGIGWIFSHLIDGTQAELVRVPFAESSLHKLPAGVSDEAAVMLSDILREHEVVGSLDLDQPSEDLGHRRRDRDGRSAGTSGSSGCPGGVRASRAWPARTSAARTASPVRPQSAVISPNRSPVPTATATVSRSPSGPASTIL